MRGRTKETYPMILGRTAWAIPGGHIPLRSTGREPDFTSRDRIALLNATTRTARVVITIFYADQDPRGPYRLVVKPRRVRYVRFNDLIDPEALPLDTDYAALVESDVPVVVQFGRLNSGQPELAVLGAVAVPVDD